MQVLLLLTLLLLLLLLLSSLDLPTLGFGKAHFDAYPEIYKCFSCWYWFIMGRKEEPGAGGWNNFCN